MSVWLYVAGVAAKLYDLFDSMDVSLFILLENFKNSLKGLLLPAINGKRICGKGRKLKAEERYQNCGNPQIFTCSP